ncbi:MAG: Foldase protein PrsA 1 precursor [Lentisphaerae bacterium ADurb.BinA184]|nr:MAG: Foldase protein PrsA 1 precursor [Lentisphaerae bacterium ADurb.BinA184]
MTARAVGPFSKYGVVEGIKASERFTEAAYALGPENPFSGLIYDGNSYLVACWVETVPGAKAESLTPELRGKIKDALLAAKARAFYQQNVESYRAFLRTGLSPDELKTHLADGSLKGLLPDAKLDMPPAEFNRGIDTYVRPYYVAPEKRVRVVAFEAAAYRDKIGDITAADLEAYYADHKSDYEEQVKASHILVRVKEDAKDDEKAAARTKAEGIRDRIVKGADFAAVARAESEDTGSGFQGGDLGFFGRGKMVKPFEDAAFALEKEALSELVETPFGLHIIKVTDRKPARTLDEAAVTEEVRGKVGDERAKQLAMKAAGDFAYGVYEYTEEPGAGQSVAQAFGDYATKDGRAFQDTGWFGQYGGVEPFLSADLAAGREAFKVSAKQPVSTVIEGDGRYFVVCLLDEKAGYLPEFSEQRQALVTQVLGQMRNEESVRVARQKAREAHAAIVAALAEGKAFDTLKAAYRFGGVDAFTLKSPPRAAFSDVIVATVPTLAVGTLSEPQETPTGAVLVYLRERVAPGDKAIQEKLAETEAALLREKQQAALQEFLKRLEEDSGTRLKEGVAGSAAL